MSKPTSGISSAVSIRISNELLEAIKEYAIAHNIINTSGRNDDRGKPNLSQAFSELVSVALGLNTVSDSVISPDNNDLRDTVKKLSDTVLTLSDRLASVENAIATSTSEATASAKKPTESDKQEGEVLPIIEAIASLPTAKSLPDKIAAAKIVYASKLKITYKHAPDGSLILKSIRGIELNIFKKLSDGELEAIGLYRESKGLSTKYWEILDDQRESKAIATSTIEAIKATDDLQTIESLAFKFNIPFNLTVPTLKKIYIRLVPSGKDRLIDATTASKADFIQAFKELGYI